MRSYGNVVDLIRIPELEFHPLAQRGKHLSENNLLVPDGLIAALLNRGLALE